MNGSEIKRRGLIANASATISLAAAPNAFVVPARAASLIEDAFDTFVSQLGLGQFPLPPRADMLNGHTPDLQGLARDILGIINQLQDKNVLDGGDSAHRTGVAAFCNSTQDSDLLQLFESNGIMVRHPSQIPWNNWRNCTRDQLIGYTSGCWRAGRLAINQRLLGAHATRIPPFTCQDTENDYPGSVKNPPIGDPLGLDDIMYLRICAGDNSAFMDPAGQFALQLGVELADPEVTVDKNNLILHCIVCGRLNLLVQVLPNYEDALRYYWSGWRKQSRIAEEFIWAIKKELERYPTIAIPLLPTNVIALLRSLDLKAELTNIDPLHHAQLAVKFAQATLKDAANTFVNTQKLALELATTQLNKLGATVDQIAKAFAAIGQAPNAIRDALKANGFPDLDVGKAVRAAFPGIPHVDTAAVPGANISATPHVDVGAVHTDVGATHTNLSTGHVDTTTGHTNTTTGHTDFGGGWAPHGDVGGIHADFGGVHADTGGVHTDFGTPHVDNIITPHADISAKAHIDTPSTLHVDAP